MNVARAAHELPPGRRAVAIGTFDGVHRGHRAVIEALRACGVRPSHAGLRAGAAWIAAQRNPDGGFGTAGRGTPTDANSTAGAIRALRAMGRTPPPAARAALRRLQDRDGGVRSSRVSAGSRLIATTDALIAFAGGHLPQR